MYLTPLLLPFASPARTQKTQGNEYAVPEFAIEESSGATIDERQKMHLIPLFPPEAVDGIMQEVV